MTSPSNLPCPPLLRAQFGMEIGSNQEIDGRELKSFCVPLTKASSIAKPSCMVQINFGAWNLAKSALPAEFQGFSCKFRPLKNIFRTLENGHSIRHQSIPRLSAARLKPFYVPFSQPQALRSQAALCRFLRHKRRSTWCPWRCASRRWISPCYSPDSRHATTTWLPSPQIWLHCPEGKSYVLQILEAANSGKSKWGLSNGGLGYLSSIVHNCQQVSSFCHENSFAKAPKRPQMCTIADDCARVP